MALCGSGRSHRVTELFKPLEKVVLKLSLLVMVHLRRTPKALDEVVVQFVCYSLGRLIAGGVRLGVSSKVVHYDKDIFIATIALL